MIIKVVERSHRKIRLTIVPPPCGRYCFAATRHHAPQEDSREARPHTSADRTRGVDRYSNTQTAIRQQAAAAALLTASEQSYAAAISLCDLQRRLHITFPPGVKTPFH